MSNFLYTLSTVVLFVLGSSIIQNKNQHVGLWKGTDKGDVGYINLDSSGTAFFVINNDTLGGAQQEEGQPEMHIKYEVNYSSSPYTIDIIKYLPVSNMEQGRVLGIFKFSTADEMILSIDFSGTARPTEFTGGGAITLARQSE